MLIVIFLPASKLFILTRFVNLTHNKYIKLGTVCFNSITAYVFVGMDISDDCNLEKKAVKITIDTLIRAGYGDIGSCSKDEQAYENSTVVGKENKIPFLSGNAEYGSQT